MHLFLGVSNRIQSYIYLDQIAISTLCFGQLVGIYDEVLSLQMLWLNGYPLQQSIYRFTYLYEPELYQNSPPLKVLIEGMYFWGNLLYGKFRSVISILRAQGGG